MERNGFRSNSLAGDNFIMGLISIEERWEKARKVFTEFIDENGFTAWHIHDGWVMHGYNSGNILHHEDIRIVWIAGYAGYSHVYRCPKVGEKMIICKSPTGDELEPFDLNCYEVVERIDGCSSEIKLKRIEVKQAVFNESKYRFYVKPISKIKKFFRGL